MNQEEIAKQQRKALATALYWHVGPPVVSWTDDPQDAKGRGHIMRTWYFRGSDEGQRCELPQDE